MEIIITKTHIWRNVVKDIFLRATSKHDIVRIVFKSFTFKDTEYIQHVAHADVMKNRFQVSFGISE